jgi:hypothetical protein
MVLDYSIVYVTWADAHTSEAGWLDLDEYLDDGEALVHTVGFLIPLGQQGSKKDHVTLWQTISSNDAIHGFHIPVAMVRDVKVLAGSVDVSTHRLTNTD